MAFFHSFSSELLSTQLAVLHKNYLIISIAHVCVQSTSMQLDINNAEFGDSKFNYDRRKQFMYNFITIIDKTIHTQPNNINLYVLKNLSTLRK